MKSLDLDLDSFRKLLDEACDLIIDRFDQLEKAKAYGGNSPIEVKSWFDEPLPETGMDPKDLLALTKEKVLDTATLNMGP